MRIGITYDLRQDAPLPVGARHAEIAQRFAQRLADAHTRVERLGRLLEDELDAAAQLRPIRADGSDRPWS